MILRLKKIIETLPYPIGRWMVFVPFSLRFGKQYVLSQKNVEYFSSLNNFERHDYIFKRFQHIVEYAFSNNYFYNEFYKKNGFSPEQLKNFNDIKEVPIVKKEDLKRFSIESRSNNEWGRILTNTGGTSGEPLDFFLDRHAFAREWAHMRYIWKKLDYKPTDLKLTFRGRNLGNKNLVYNPIHNEYIVNTYAPVSDVIAAISKIIKKRTIRFIHGYPSAVYNFTVECSKRNNVLVQYFRNNLKGILLGSEYPAQVYRTVIKDVFQTPTLSWYGHSEMAILAYEASDEFLYYPMQTYGYCEAVPDDNENFRLVGTSYFNTVSPFIRYDSGDLITPVGQEGEILERFRISEGRVGDFILDSNGQRISLTSLIFGRHHPMFNFARYIQVQQRQAGKATLIITLLSDLNTSLADYKELFDLSHVAIDFSFEIVSKPIRTSSGKIPLLIHSSAR